MSDIIATVLAAAATAYVWYVTIKGYRTGVLNLRGGRVERSVSPRMFALTLVTIAVVCLVSLAAVALMIYGQTHPDWRHGPAKHATQSSR